MLSKIKSKVVKKVNKNAKDAYKKKGKKMPKTQTASMGVRG
jgi:hypothetical protein